MPERQFVSYSFFKINPVWRALPEERRAEDKRQFVATIEEFADDMLIRPYSTVGTRGDADLMLWRATEDLDLIHRCSAALNRLSIAQYLQTPYNYLAMTRRSIYVTRHQHEGQEGRRTKIRPADRKYLVVYPFVKTRPWYRLSMEERQAMMDVHIKVGHKYPSVKINTSYSFGLDDQEFVVAFETDKLDDFLDLVMELRESEASAYTLRDVPTFTCTSMELSDALDAIG